MEASELYNFSISPVVTGSFVIERSQDNHVSLITHRGVHVFVSFASHLMNSTFLINCIKIHQKLRFYSRKIAMSQKMT